MTVLSTRIPDDLDEELKRFIREENIEKSGAVRKLLISGLEEWKRRKALELLSEGRISFNRAAEIAGMDVWEFTDLIMRTRTTRIIEDWFEEDME
ncbi:MAG TPA: hypothetical protein ENK47_00280 [Euryarchaeota archaeon]|nr:MAG: hypothetical protein DRN57_05760 [Thermoplasmata archaeon]HHD15125.1 hypothetical protein [Euryarchaeota archaeon]